MTQTLALSTAVVTPFAQRLSTNERYALDEAQEIADTSGTPCGVWERGGWFTVCELAPEMIEPDPMLAGWALWSIADPRDEEA
jgi:hypothetical protein